VANNENATVNQMQLKIFEHLILS